MPSRFLLKCQFLHKGGCWELWIGEIWGPCPRPSGRSAVTQKQVPLTGQGQTTRTVGTMTSWVLYGMPDKTKTRYVYRLTGISLCWLPGTMTSLSKDSQTSHWKIYLGIQSSVWSSLVYDFWNSTLFSFLKIRTLFISSPLVPLYVSNSKNERRWFWSLLGALWGPGP